MTPYDYVIADVFTDTPFGGNQLAVFPDARGLTDRAMQSLAREFNFAESTFVFPPGDPAHSRRVRIFSPGAEMPFAGHPTVGTAAVLVHLGQVAADGGRATLVFEENVGPVSVAVETVEGRLRSTLTLSGQVQSAAGEPSAEAVASTLSLRPADVHGVWYGSVGLPFLFAHLRDAKAVDQAVLDKGAWTARIAGGWAQHVFLFSGDLTPGGRLYARMFAPGIGVDEDPATGSAAAALVGVLAQRQATDACEVSLVIEQGVAMGRPSLIEASALKRSGQVDRVAVGGSTTVVGSGRMSVPNGL